MKRLARVDLFVILTAAASVATLAASWPSQLWPGGLTLGCLILVAFLLDQTSTQLRVEATGSTSFVIHMAAGILLGGFWGGVVAGVSTGLSQAARRPPLVKVVFNIAQRTFSVAGAMLLYRALGGGVPPAYLQAEGLTTGIVQRDIGLFFVFAATYFAINSTTVNTAIALSTGRPFREVWDLNLRGVLGYDLGASTIAVLVAWLYHKSEELLGFGPIGLIGIIVPIVIIRHIYGMYRRLQASGRELLELMVKAIEARDPYTSGHSIRVATLSKVIAQDLGLSPGDVELIATAALLHDVGKIYEEFAPLLRKDTKLTSEETALLQTHVVKSAELVAIISSFRGKVYDAVRSHHERWDGNGYPDGVAGAQIPIGARIIMISDTIDAMTTDRPYRKALGLEAVIAELQKHKGSQFDPELVDVVMSSVAVRRVLNGPLPSPEFLRSDAPLEGGSTRVRARAAGMWRVLRT